MPELDDLASVHRRRSIRLRDFDYATHGAYFVTLVTHERRELFGRISGDAVELNAAGRIAQEEWLRSGEIRSNVEIDAFVVMPNHFHGVIFLLRDDEGALRSAPARAFGSSMAGSLPVVIRNFKGAVTRQLREGGFAEPVWQRNYYERVIRDERELQAIRQYIIDNPQQWALDKENPESQV